jgi:hypothetical protein
MTLYDMRNTPEGAAAFKRIITALKSLKRIPLETPVLRT